MLFSICLCMGCSGEKSTISKQENDIEISTIGIAKMNKATQYYIYVEKNKYNYVPKYIILSIEDEFCDPADCRTIFIEKNYDKIYDRYVTKNFGGIYQPITEGENGRWARIPFEFDGAQLRSVSKQKLTGVIYLENNLTSAYEFTPGAYRLVLEYSDGSLDRTEFRIY